ncbi:formate dehydrogenase subunit alpha [Pelagicoccus sp. SDUM812002]|uniref:formate dehydrogenase subunit alpha n=1 Tax=Pelagicoccus sp. SDUM812002 TaxID=3041266 RepID=UPI0034E1D1FD
MSCGHCVTVCPCNALMEKSMIGEAGHFTGAPKPVLRKSIDLVKYAETFTGLGPLFATSKAEAAMRDETIKRTKTVCTYCGVGCAFEVWTKGRHILKVQPHKDAPANGISTCVKGKFGWDFVNSDERLVNPIIRRDGKFDMVEWDEALEYTAKRLRAIVDEHGPDSVAFISSSKITNEECYLVQKLARAVFGTNNVDNCARYCQSPASKGLSRTVGYGADAGSMDDITKAELVFIVGSNTAVSHPVLAARIKRQVKVHGQRLIVSDLRSHEMADRAQIFLQPNPGTDLVWINAVAKYILDQGWEDRDFIERRVKDLEKYRDSLQKFTLEFAAARTGLTKETLKQVAKEIASAKTVCGLWAMGVTQHMGGTDCCTAISNLLLLTGNFGKPGTGAYPLRGHNNVQGSCDFGALYNYLPGYASVGSDEARKPFEDAWGMKLPSAKGLNNKTMIDAIEEGTLKALYVVGEELALVDSNARRVQEQLEKLEFFAVQEIFFSTTARFADVVLPGTPSLEKEGTFVNTERRVQLLNEALPPLKGCRPDWKILRDLARHLGHDWNYESPSDIMDEVAGIVPEFAGIRYDRLKGYNSLCWPVDKDGNDTPLLYEEKFHTADGKAAFFPVDFAEPVNQPDEEYPQHLNNGRVLEHFHEGNMTFRVKGCVEKIHEAFVEMNPADANEQGLEEGDWVEVRSPFGKVTTQIVVSDSLRSGELYMPICSTEQRVNHLTSTKADPVVDTPAYKEMSASVKKLGRRSASPIPKSNPRNGKPTPLRSVRVEDKWRRDDYHDPETSRPDGGNV